MPTPSVWVVLGSPDGTFVFSNKQLVLESISMTYNKIRDHISVVITPNRISVLHGPTDSEYMEAIELPIRTIPEHM